MSQNLPNLSGNPTQQPMIEDDNHKEVQVPKIRPPLPPDRSHLMSHEQFLRPFAVQDAGPTNADIVEQEPEKQSVKLNLQAVEARYAELILKNHTWTDAEELELRAIVAHCKALDLPVTSASTNPKPLKQDAAKTKQKRPYKPKTDTFKAAIPPNWSGQIVVPPRVRPLSLLCWFSGGYALKRRGAKRATWHPPEASAGSRLLCRCSYRQ